MLIFTITLMTLVVVCLLWLNKRQNASEMEQVESSGQSRVIERVESKFKSPTEDELIAIINKSIAASDEATVMANFRLGTNDVGAALRYLMEQHAERGAPTSTSWLGSIDANDMLIEGALLNWKNDEKTPTLQVFLTPNERGVWQIDYDAFVGKCAPAWDSFVSGEATEGVVRVWFTSDNYYNGVFGDESKWVSYSIARPDSESLILGYCQVGSPQDVAMKNIIERTRMRGKSNLTSFRATLEISRPEGAEQRQFEIKRVLAEDWVVSDKAFDGGPLH